ncbi:hypothetical protein ACLOJK_024420 [Asimina triloba]
MGTSVQVTPLCGVYSDNPLSYLLSIDDFNFLVDCGWNDLFDPQLLQPLAKISSTVDAVLLSHPDTLHLGALPYAMKHLGLSAPVFSTEPVYRLGLLTMYDHYLSRKAKERELSSHLMWQVIYLEAQFGRSQKMGRMLYMLLISTIVKNGSILSAYADSVSSMNNNASAVKDQFLTVLITDAYNALNNQPTRRQRDQEFLDAIMKTLRADGNVLLPVDTAGRVLELILILEQVVLASMASLEAGFSHDIFVEWATEVKNLVLFTERGQCAFPLCFDKHVTPSSFVNYSQFGTLARMLQADPPPKAVKVTMSKRVPLVGEELIAYEEEQNRIKKEEALKATLVKEEDLKSSHGSDANKVDPMVIDVSTNHAMSDVTSPRFRHRDIVIGGFVPPSTSVAPMFPFFENSPEWDDFGEVINPDDYVIKEDELNQASMLAIGGELDGKLDEGAASWLLDTRPSKVVSNELTVQVKCSLIYMDFEGRSDGRSIKAILGHVAPLKLSENNKRVLQLKLKWQSMRQSEKQRVVENHISSGESRVYWNDEVES